jgi:hypothetical protein
MTEHGRMEALDFQGVADDACDLLPAVTVVHDTALPDRPAVAESFG